MPKLTAAFPDGLGHWQSGRVTVGVHRRPDLVQDRPGPAHAGLDVVPQAVLNLAGGKPPASAGRVELADHFDVGKILAQLPHAAHLQDGTALTRGTLDQSVKLALTPDRGTVAVDTHLTDVAGTPRRRQPQPVTLQPVDLTPGRGRRRRQVGRSTASAIWSLKLTSKFAHADFHGATIGDLAGTLTAQLQALQAEARPAGRLRRQEAGRRPDRPLGQHRPAHAGPVPGPGQGRRHRRQPAVRRQDRPTVAEPLVAVNLTGDLSGSEKSAVEQVKNGLLTLKAGPADAPAVDLAVAVPMATLGDAPAADFQLTKLHVDVPQAQRQFANVPAGTAGLICASGDLTAVAAGHYGPDGVRLDPSKLSLANLTIQRQLATGKHGDVLTGETVTASAAGTVGLGATKTVDLTDLSVADTAHLFDVHKGDGDFQLTQSADAAGGHGTLAVAADLAGLSRVLQTATASTPADGPPAGQVKSGHLAGTLAFAAAAGGRTDISGTFDVPDLDVASGTTDTGPQKATIVVKGASDAASHTVTLTEAIFKAPFASAGVSDVAVLLSAPSTVDEVQKASFALDVPDLRTADALLLAFTKPAPMPPAAPDGKPAPVPTPPLVVTAGSVSVHGQLTHDGDNLVLTVPTVTATNVAFTRGTASYAAKPITAHLAATVGTAAGKTVAEQLRGLRVTQLDATTGVATVTMTTPITVADLSDPAASAAGGIKVDGELADLSALLAAFEAKPADAYPYRGQYTLTEDLTGGNGLAVKGGVERGQVPGHAGPAGAVRRGPAGRRQRRGPGPRPEHGLPARGVGRHAEQRGVERLRHRRAP